MEQSSDKSGQAARGQFNTCSSRTTVAAVAFAGVLVAVMRSGEVQQILTDLVRGALVP